MTMRDRMKRETNRALTRAAQDLVHERGAAHVTVDDIAAAAGVSVRTFFNYFTCKEAAIVGIPPEGLEALAAALRERPASEAPLQALRGVVLDQARLDDIQHRWMLRAELVQREPNLLPHYLAALTNLEAALVPPLAERMGSDPSTDPAPALLVAATLGALRAAAAYWEQSDRSTPLLVVLEKAFEWPSAGATN